MELDSVQNTFSTNNESDNFTGNTTNKRVIDVCDISNLNKKAHSEKMGDAEWRELHKGCAVGYFNGTHYITGEHENDLQFPPTISKEGISIFIVD